MPWGQWLESSTTLCLERVRQVAVPVGRHTTTVFDGVHQNAGPVGEEQSLLSTIDLFINAPNIGGGATLKIIS